MGDMVSQAHSWVSPARRERAQAYSPTVCSKLLGINYNTILYWVRTKLVRASVRYEAKQWTPVLFARSDLVDMCTVKAMRSRGASTRRIRRTVALLRRERKRDVRPDFIDATKDTVALLKAEQLPAALGRYPPALIVDVSSAERFVDKALERLQRSV